MHKMKSVFTDHDEAAHRQDDVVSEKSHARGCLSCGVVVLLIIVGMFTAYVINLRHMRLAYKKQETAVLALEKGTAEIKWIEISGHGQQFVIKDADSLEFSELCLRESPHRPT